MLLVLRFPTNPSVDANCSDISEKYPLFVTIFNAAIDPNPNSILVLYFGSAFNSSGGLLDNFGITDLRSAIFELLE